MAHKVIYFSRKSAITIGGVSENNMNEYLQLKNVIAIGGSWLATKKLITAKAYDQITIQTKEVILKT